MCRVLGVASSGFYAWRGRSTSARGLSNQRLAVDIRAVHNRSRQTYGSPRVHQALEASGVVASRNRVARVMRAEQIQARRRKAYRVTTNSAHNFPVASNILERKFSTVENSEPNRAWVSDLTYIHTGEGWLYLAVIIDLCSRRVVGWSMKHTIDRSLPLDALGMAVSRRAVDPGLIFHTDRGSQYASEDHRSALTAAKMICSMSRRGNCWDNAVAESFFATLKGELVVGSDWQTREAARTAIFEYIEVWYNRSRLHSSIGYMSPEAYELSLTTRAPELTNTQAHSDKTECASVGQYRS